MVVSEYCQRLLQVGDRVGKNEKTKVTCKLQRADAGPPGREPVSMHTTTLQI
jgi:Cilia- and flagella-associated protein 298